MQEIPDAPKLGFDPFPGREFFCEIEPNLFDWSSAPLPLTELVFPAKVESLPAVQRERGLEPAVRFCDLRVEAVFDVDRRRAMVEFPPFCVVDEGGLPNEIKTKPKARG